MFDGILKDSLDTTEHRLCGTCNQCKPVSEFYKDGRNSAGEIRYRRDCKECYNVTRARELAMKRQKGDKK